MVATRHLFAADVASRAKLNFSGKILRSSSLLHALDLRTSRCNIYTGDVWVPNNVASDACTAMTLLAYHEAVVLSIAFLAGATIRVTTALKLST